MRIYLNDDWAFTDTFSMELLKADCALALESVRLPHTTKETPYHYFDEGIYQAVSGYRRVLTPDSTWQGQHILLTIEAAGHAAWVYLNGAEIASHFCGYTAFTVDLAPHLMFGKENILVIQVDSRETLDIPPFGNVIDYMTYGGLYREVYLDIKPQSYIKDVFPKTTLSGDGKAVLACEITCASPESRELVQSLYDPAGILLVKSPWSQEGHTFSDITYWHPDHPALYTLVTELLENGQVVDTHEVRVGFRTAAFRADGFYLNGDRFRLRGLDRHQSYPYVGYAVPEAIQRMDADVLKHELGLNAVRTSHYPQSHHFLDRCDELGLLVFTEIPGWQYIGGEAWQDQAVQNTRDMVLEYRNHPSIILWGVRINESMDHDALYTRTNEAAHSLDDTRQTSGVRFIQQSSLLEDVYAYNDFTHTGKNPGCIPRKKATPDLKKGYLISEYNGHMYPTKIFDGEDHRVEHMLRHARVVNAYYGYDDIAGGFGWCMADYNTHQDFGSGDRICYHGVLDMFRNPKPAAWVYSAEGKAEPFLEISSTMDIGEHPGGALPDVYALTNADSIKVYKNDKFIREYTHKDSPFQNLANGPIQMEDFVGELMEHEEGFTHQKAEDVKKVLLAANKYGMNSLPLSAKLTAAKCMARYGMTFADANALYGKYIGNWGATVTIFRFDAIKDGKVVAQVEKGPVKAIHLEAQTSHTTLCERTTYDMAAIRLKAADQKGNVLPFYNQPLRLSVTGPIQIIGPDVISLKGGLGGTYIKTLGESGQGIVTITGDALEPVEIRFTIEGSEKL